MADKKDILHMLSACQTQDSALSQTQIREAFNQSVPERTLRRWLSELVSSGKINRIGKYKGTRYYARSSLAALPSFLLQVPRARREVVLKQIRDLWTHTSTAIEGNTLSLGDTQFILEEGLTVSGKPIKEHQQIIGHATAIELIYHCLNKTVDLELCFALHKAIQDEHVFDIEKPYGAWKVVENGTYTIDDNNQSVYLSYAKPLFVPKLMKELLTELNQHAQTQFTLEQAPYIYSKIHTGFAHIHPFWDGNGRLARLIANIPLLQNGFPPLVIDAKQRREYIQTLAHYQFMSGELTHQTGVWPREELLKPFTGFCTSQYALTMDIIERAT